METVKGDLSYSLVLRMLLTLAVTIVLIFLAISTITATLLFRQPILALGLYDNFEGPPYTLTDNKTSPNGKWFNKYNGFGESGTVAISPLAMVDTNSTVFY